MLFEVSVIIAEIAGRGEPILFELSIGTFGESIDGKFEPSGLSFFYCNYNSVLAIVALLEFIYMYRSLLLVQLL